VGRPPSQGRQGSAPRGAICLWVFLVPGVSVGRTFFKSTRVCFTPQRSVTAGVAGFAGLLRAHISRPLSRNSAMQTRRINPTVTRRITQHPPPLPFFFGPPRNRACLQLSKLLLVVGTLVAITCMTYAPTILFASTGLTTNTEWTRKNFRYSFLILIGFLAIGVAVQLAAFTVALKWILAGSLFDSYIWYFYVRRARLVGGWSTPSTGKNLSCGCVFLEGSSGSVLLHLRIYPETYKRVHRRTTKLRAPRFLRL